MSGSPLNINVPIVDQNGRPTPAFLRWVQDILGVTGQVVPLVTPAEVSGVLDILGDDQGSVLYRDETQWDALPPGTAGDVLTTAGVGANPSWQTPVRAFLDLSDVPVTYTGSGGLVVAVKASEDGLEFVPDTGGDDISILFDASGLETGEPYILFDFED